MTFAQAEVFDPLQVIFCPAGQKMTCEKDKVQCRERKPDDKRGQTDGKPQDVKAVISLNIDLKTPPYTIDLACP